MNKQNLILDLASLLNTYKTCIPKKQLQILKNRNWLPLGSNSKLAEEFAYLVGKVMGDGHLDKLFSPMFIGNAETIKNLKTHLTNAFGLEDSKFSISIRKSRGHSHRLIVKDALLGRLLFCLGAPQGNKTQQGFFIPDWILGNKQYKKRFLQAILEDELTTIKIEKVSHSVNPKFKLAKQKEFIEDHKVFMKQVKEAIESFGVNCSSISTPIKKKDTASFDIYFRIQRNKRNIINFANEIGFSHINVEKSNDLEICCKILEETLLHRKPLIDRTQILDLRKQGMSIRKISAKVNLNRSSVHRVITKNN